MKLNVLNLLCFHRASQYNEVWGRGTYITLFSPSSLSKRFPVVSFVHWDVYIQYVWSNLAKQLLIQIFIALLNNGCYLVSFYFHRFNNCSCNSIFNVNWKTLFRLNRTYARMTRAHNALPYFDGKLFHPLEVVGWSCGWKFKLNNVAL